MAILHTPQPIHQQLTAAIAEAYQRGDDAEVDALLRAKTVLIRRETAAAQREPSGARQG